MIPRDFFVIPGLTGNLLYYQGHQLPHQLPLPELLPEPLDELPTVGHFWFDT